MYIHTWVCTYKTMCIAHTHVTCSHLHHGKLRWIISRLVHFHFIYVTIEPQILTASVVSHSINFLRIWRVRASQPSHVNGSIFSVCCDGNCTCCNVMRASNLRAHCSKLVYDVSRSSTTQLYLNREYNAIAYNTARRR